MGKRSGFERTPRDYYRTFDPKAGIALKPYVKENSTYIEPFAGAGDLINQLTYLNCVGKSDIEPQVEGIETKDAFLYTEADFTNVDFCISNPPWDRKLLHPLIEHFANIVPTWYLHDSDWLFNKSSSPLISKYLVKVVTIGRMRWQEDTNMSGKDNCIWALYDVKKSEPTIFHGR